MNTATTTHITPLTNQQLFDNALFGIRRQNYATSGKEDNGFTYLYRGPNGTKCGIGHSIPDELYCSEMEETCVGSLIAGPDYHDSLAVLFSGVDSELASRVQDAHDSGVNMRTSTVKMDPGSFEARMEAVASRFGLTYTQGLPDLAPTGVPA